MQLGSVGARAGTPRYAGMALTIAPSTATFVLDGAMLMTVVFVAAAPAVRRKLKPGHGARTSHR